MMAPLWWALLACAPTPDSPHIHPHEGPPTDPEPSAPATSVWPLPPIERVLFFGDSITAGLGASEPALAWRSLLRDNVSEVWPDHDHATLASAVVPGATWRSLARSGAHTGHLQTQLEWALADLPDPAAPRPTLVLVTIGGNDGVQALLPGVDPEPIFQRALERIDAWAEDLRQALSPAPVGLILANLYEPSDGAGQIPGCFGGIDYTDKLDAWADWNTALEAWGAEHDVPIVDLATPFSGHGRLADPSTTWLDPDCLHPNDRGHHEIRLRFLDTFVGTTSP